MERGIPGRDREIKRSRDQGTPLRGEKVEQENRRE
jgi:hypothetical protein